MIPKGMEGGPRSKTSKEGVSRHHIQGRKVIEDAGDNMQNLHMLQMEH